MNRKGTTWRKLDEATREGLTAGNAAALLARELSLVKRSVFAWAGGRWVSPQSTRLPVPQRLVV